MLKPDLLFDCLIVVALKGQQNDPAALRQGNLGRLGLGKFKQNSVLFFGHSDLGCLPWHGGTFGEDGRKEQLPSNRLFKQDQLVLAALELEDLLLLNSSVSVISRPAQAKPGTPGRKDETFDISVFAQTRRDQVPQMTWDEIYRDWIRTYPDDGRGMTKDKIRESHRRHFGDKSKASKRVSKKP